MSLDQAIRHGKEHRQPYRKAKAVDKSCRNHGSCAYCKSNRTHKNKVREDISREKMQEYQNLMSKNDIPRDSLVHTVIDEDGEELFAYYDWIGRKWVDYYTDEDVEIMYWQ